MLFNKDKEKIHKNFDTIIKKPVFRIVEAYKTLRTNILFSIPAQDGRARKILFTSSNPGDGKTTVSVNTAITFAQTDMKVILVDADLRKPTTHKFFSLANKKGLSAILSGQGTIEECVQSIPEVPNLRVITSGVLPPNPSELLSGKNMEDMLKVLEENFDVIIIDTPPVNIVADAVSVCKYVDGVVVVAANGRTTVPELQNALKSLKFADAKILGVVYNMAKQHMSKRNRTYRNYYRHTEE